MTTTPTSGAAIQRYKIGYHADEWGQRSSTPSGIPDASGSWVRYADHVTALAAGQATAAQAVVPQGWKLVPVGWQFYEDGKWWNGDDRNKDHRKNTEEARYPIRDVYVVEQQSAQPAAAPAQKGWCDGCSPDNCCGCGPAGLGGCSDKDVSELAEIFATHPTQQGLEQAIKWPKAPDVGRFGDMNPDAFIRVGLDSDNDVYVSICDGNSVSEIEFCTPGGGGGRSSRTRMALIALMCAIEADNASHPSFDFWQRSIAAQAKKGGHP